MAAEHVRALGERIRLRREELGLTQDEVARRMNGSVDGQRISKWERGENKPRDESLEDLARVLETTPFDLLSPAKGEAPEPFPQPVALEGMQADILQAIMQQLAMQTKVLQEIRSLLLREGEVASALEVATARVDEASSTLAETAAQAGRVLRDGVLRPAAAAPKPVRKRIPRAST